VLLLKSVLQEEMLQLVALALQNPCWLFQGFFGPESSFFTHQFNESPNKSRLLIFFDLYEVNCLWSDLRQFQLGMRGLKRGHSLFDPVSLRQAAWPSES